MQTIECMKETGIAIRDTVEDLKGILMGTHIMETFSMEKRMEEELITGKKQEKAMMENGLRDYDTAMVFGRGLIRRK